MELLSKNYLMHYGVKGQKYGQRRYQNPDGSLTPEGREHYGVGNARDPYQARANMTKKASDDVRKLKGYNAYHKDKTKIENDYKSNKLSDEEYNKALNDLYNSEKHKSYLDEGNKIFDTYQSNLKTITKLEKEASKGKKIVHTLLGVDPKNALYMVNNNNYTKEQLDAARKAGKEAVKNTKWYQNQDKAFFNAYYKELLK